METERLIRGKPEGKITGPLFPRLHVDDTKRLGPRAPPRNKMALYEQLSIPSQRFSNTPASTTTLPPPPVHGRMLANMLSSSQVVGAKRELFSVGKKSHATNHSTGKQNSSPYEGISDGHRQTLSVGDGNQCEENQDSTGMVDFEHGDYSHTSVKECASHGVISPNLVVEMIGQNHFWKARKEIIDQQRIFSKQVFELHRIVKVQKMLASCGNLQKKEPLSLGNSLFEPTMKKLLPKSIQEAPSWHEKSRNEVSKIKVVDNAIENLPLPSLSSDITTLATNFGKHTSTNLSMWCLPPPGTQWLLPVISPSEGLVYKPYPNPPPPPGGFFPTLSNDFRPTNPTITLGNEEFLNSQIGVHGANPSPMDPSYFAPYGMSIISPLASTSTFKQMSFFDVHSSSCTSNGTRNVGETNESEKLESTESSPNKKIKTSNGALPLFPTTPTTVDNGQPIKNCSNERKTKVIKVIPRNNPKLASESVANIIKLIQEERNALV